jgi:hypothetical protein
MVTKPAKTLKRVQSAIDAIKRGGRTLKKLKPVLSDMGTLRARHLARRTSTGVELVLADKIDFVNPVHWDTLANQSVFLSRDYLIVVENHAPDNLINRYAVAYVEGQVVAIMVFQRVKISGNQLRTGTRQRLLDKPLAKLQQHLLVCGNLLVWGERALAFAPGFDRALLWQSVGEALYRLRRSDKLLGESNLALIKDFDAVADPVAPDALRLLGYRSVETEPDMVLSVQPSWRHFDDYLTSLTSSYRSAAKRLLKDCAAQGVNFRVIDSAEMTKRQDELAALYAQVHQAQGLRLVALTAGYLPAMAAALGSQFVCRVAERDGQFLGFITNVKDGNTAIGYYVGYEREANAQAPIYLALLQFTIEEAIAFGATRLSLGRTALEPKSKMGCKPEPLFCAVRHRVSALNWVVSAITRTTEPDTAPERNPFKTQGSAP